jgi:hypothetical protein
MTRPAFAIAAAAALLGASAVNAAEPAPLTKASSDRATPRPSTLLASASAVQVPTPQSAADAVPVPKKPRAARVTSCRCGDANPR